MTRNLNKPPGLLQEIRISNRVEGRRLPQDGQIASASSCASMAFRFCHSARHGPLRLNFTRRGLSSISLGGPGASLNVPINRRHGSRSQDWAIRRSQRCGDAVSLALVSQRGW
jgi:hypothetical protein